jgi:hypothetical protein
VSVFDHAAHLRLALDCLADSPDTDAAVARVAEAIRARAEAAGQPGKYHHTLTVFWVRMAARLLDKDLPLAYYSRERLASDQARARWLEPDLHAIDDPSTHSADPSRNAPHRPVPR